ncbi:FxLD family lanthipeptide [Streptacidiphilus sp. EB103A]|uniref:FxLD family lanthipeptide n=1 Tax=Streptacidiphilus sp. EB103A TaxID=3156275 RepID=UPI003515E4E7
MSNVRHITHAQPVTADPSAISFELDVTLVEVGDAAGLVSVTDDGCGQTCGACTTNVA